MSSKEQIRELPEEERVCPQCGLPYEETGLEKQSDEIDMEPKYYYVKRYRRKVLSVDKFYSYNMLEEIKEGLPRHKKHSSQ